MDSYLTEHFIQMDYRKSDFSTITTGIPQDSIIYIIYADDTPLKLNMKLFTKKETTLLLTIY